MTLKSIVVALGGDLYAGGQRANIPAPGHSAQDRSVSLLLSQGRVVIHAFGGADWRDARDDLVRRRLIRNDGRLVAGSSDSASSREARPDPRDRTATADRLWDGGLALTGVQASGRYLDRRAVSNGLGSTGLRHHPAAPVSVYRQGGRTCPALMAGVCAPDGFLSAVELTYLEAGGGIAASLRLPRKTVGLVPAGAAVRLAEPRETLLVAEGVVTTLSAMAWFDLPGWALMAVRNLALWSPPSGVRHVVIAADRGVPGETAASRLYYRLQAQGIRVSLRLPQPGAGDWNDVVLRRQRAGSRTEEGRGGAPKRRG